MSNYRTEDLQSYTDIFKALSNPHRLAIFLRLIRCCAPGTTCGADGAGCVCVGELGRDLGIVPSTVSHHIKELRHAGLIQMERRGQTIQCSIAPDALKELSRFLTELAPEGALLCGFETGSEGND